MKLLGEFATILVSGSPFCAIGVALALIIMWRCGTPTSAMLALMACAFVSFMFFSFIMAIVENSTE